MLKLLYRFYDPTCGAGVSVPWDDARGGASLSHDAYSAGSVRVNGVDVRGVQLASLRQVRIVMKGFSEEHDDCFFYVFVITCSVLRKPQAIWSD